MAKKKSGTGGGGDEATAKREDPLQAVLLADSFINSFRPLSLDRPKVLCPLNNVTMLDYALDFLAGAGVEELFVVCVSDEVENYLAEPSRVSSSMQTTVIKDGTLTTAGDALRELDKRDLVQSDPFIFMFGDTVANVDLKAAIATHKERRRKDLTAIMTILFKQVGASQVTKMGVNQSSIRSCTDDLVVGIDSKRGNRILLYDDHSSSSSVALPCSFFAAHSEVDIRCDLSDCGIDLCSPDVLARFQDEFDYLKVRKFVSDSVAEEEEGLQNKIYAHILGKNEYAARVNDLATYAAISRDLLRRWCYPVVPDNLPSGYKKAYRYSMQRHYMYFEQKNGKTQVGRGTMIQGAGMMGANCSVGDCCRIEQTVVGHRCKLGSGVTMLGTILWDNVVVEDGATVVQSILAYGAVVKEGAVINRGCVIGAGCVIGKGVVIPEFTRITLHQDEDDDFEDDWSEDEEENEEDRPDKKTKKEDVFQTEVDVVGADGKGQVWKAPAEDDEDEEIYGMSTSEVVLSQSIGFDPKELFYARMKAQEEERDAMSDVDEGQASILSGDDYDDNVEFGAPAPSNDVIGRQKGVDVIKELKSICLEYELSTPIENLAIELNSFKFSQNASYADCTMAATMALLERLGITKNTKDKKLLEDFKASLKHWAPLLEKMSNGLDDQKAIILGLENCAIGEDEMGQVLSTGMTFRLFLQHMHDEEIVSEDAIFAWAADRREEPKDSPRGKIFNMSLIQEFLEWLEDDDEEESEDDSQDDD